MLIAHKRNPRSSRRGTALAYCMGVFVLVSVAGTTMFAVNSQHQMQILHYGLMTRLRAATESALETTRGRFTLVQTTQESWASLLPNAGWNTIQTLNVNGASVVVSGMNVGTPTTPRCRLRAVGSLSGRQWAAQYEFRPTSMGDFSYFSGGPNTQSIPSNTWVGGGYYSKGSINLNNESNIHFLKHASTSGSVMSPGNATWAEGYSTSVPQVNFQLGTLTFPEALSQVTSTHRHYRNTYKIELRGTVYRRHYSYKPAAGGNIMTTEDLPIPHNGIIYVGSRTDAPPAGIDCANPAHTNTNARANNDDVEFWGWLDNRRVSIFIADEVKLMNCVTYQTLLNNPDLRRFSEKKSPAALAMVEMLQLLSNSDISVHAGSFTPLASGQTVTNNAAYTAYDGSVHNDVGHQTNQFALDGIYIGYGEIERSSGNVAATGRELWLCGGMLSGTSPINNLFASHIRNNMDWDYRFETEEPPMVIKIYDQPPRVISGTFRSYQP